MYKVGELIKIYVFNSDKIIFNPKDSTFEYGIILEINIADGNNKTYKVAVNNKIFYTIETYMEKIINESKN